MLYRNCQQYQIIKSDGNGNPQRDYIYLNGEPLALKLYGTQAGMYFFINDHLGTPQKITDSSAQVVWAAAYLPFGKAQVTTGTVENNLRFPGQYFDSESGLHYNWNRYYDPETGRYITADPIGLTGGVNLYAYVMGNPVNLTDPSGLASITVYAEPTQYGSIGVKSNWGHAWISIKLDNGSAQTVGFYPEGPQDDHALNHLPGIASYTWLIKNDAAVDAYLAIMDSNFYYPAGANCVSRVKAAMDAAHIPHPSFSSAYNAGISMPDKLYEWLKELNNNPKIPPK